MTQPIYRRALIQREAQPQQTQGERVFPIVASTEDLDSYDTIVESSWLLERYLKNPVVLWDHNAHLSDATLPIGTVRNLRVENGALVGEMVLASERANPRAEQVYQSILEGTLRGVSVGFYPQDIREEMRDGREIYVLSNNELYEISVTAVPANPNALIQLRSRARNRRNMKDKQTRAEGEQPAAPSMSDYEAFSAYVANAAEDVEGMTDEQKSSVSKAVKARMDQCKAATTPATTEEQPMTESARALLRALNAKTPEAALVLVEQLQARAAKADELQKQLDQAELDKLVSQARREGKLTPAMESKPSWERTVKRGLDAVKEALELIDPVAMLRTAEEQPVQSTNSVYLTDEDKEVCARTGQDPEKFLAHKRSIAAKNAA